MSTKSIGTRSANGPEVIITQSTTRGRVTPPAAAGRFKQVMGESASALMGGVEAASGFIPGGQVVSAAVRSARGGAAGGGVAGMVTSTGAASAESPAGTAGGGGSYETMASGFADDSMRLIMLQQQIQSENQQYSAISNVLKTRHETAKNAIGNLR